MKVSSVLPIFLLLAGFSTNVIAQQQTTGGGGDDNEPPRNTQVSNSNNPPPSNTNRPQTTAPSRNNDEEEESPRPSPRPSNSRSGDDEEDPGDDPPSRTSPTNAIITPTGRPSDDEESPDLSEPGATISSPPTGTGDGEMPPPKYTPPDNARYDIPDYPPPAVPNTKNAPYMQKSDLPEGTVFIAVGAALGLIGLIAFAWRMVVAWQLRRSIHKANMATTTESKAGLLGRYNAPSSNPKKSFYSAAAAGSSVSLDHLGSSRTGLGTPNTSLFFSPTMQSGSPVHQNRGSAYLPAGYYAPAASPGMGFNQSRDSLPRPRPATRDSPAHGTPPASPLLTPQARRASPGQGHHHGASISSRTSVAQPGGRTPSTYLEDMLDDPTAGASDQAKRNSRRKSGHSYTGYGGAGSGSRR